MTSLEQPSTQSRITSTLISRMASLIHQEGIARRGITSTDNEATYFDTRNTVQSVFEYLDDNKLLHLDRAGSSDSASRPVSIVENDTRRVIYDETHYRQAASQITLLLRSNNEFPDNDKTVAERHVQARTQTSIAAQLLERLHRDRVLDFAALSSRPGGSE